MDIFPYCGFNICVSSMEKAIEIYGSGPRYTCVVDSDTIWFEGEKIRIMAYDTPEPSTNICGGDTERRLVHVASERLVELLNEAPYTIERHGAESYGCTLAIVQANCEDVGDTLLSEGLARYWPDGEEFWCE